MMVQAFYITVDGQKYGPFHTRNEEKMERLMHRKGVEVEYAMVEKANIIPPPKKRRKKAEQVKMEFGGWVPVGR